MPLIVMCGIPASGKSTQSQRLRDFIVGLQQIEVHIVSENDTIQASKQHKNDVFSDSSKEKAIRGQIMSEAKRLVGTEGVTIVDASNYIKGYRYELYCMSKATKTTQCTVMCSVAIERAWEWNLKREKNEQYSKEVFEGLMLRFEEPDSMNRWENPMFVVNSYDDIPLLEIYNALFDRKPPPPNQSTLCTPLASGTYLSEMDKITSTIVSNIQAAQRLNFEGAINIPGYTEKIMLTPGSKVTTAELANLRRQFHSYQKLHPGTEVSKLGSSFIHFVNTHLPRDLVCRLQKRPFLSPIIYYKYDGVQWKVVPDVWTTCYKALKRNLLMQELFFVLGY